jgi:hypothetical protein
MQVWLAEWTGCQVAVKELLGFSNGPDDADAWKEMQNEVRGVWEGDERAWKGDT